MTDSLIERLKEQAALEDTFGTVHPEPEVVSSTAVVDANGEPYDEDPKVSPRDGFRSRGIKEG